MYKYKFEYDKDTKEYLDERHLLAVERLREIAGEELKEAPVFDYFHKLAVFLLKTDEILNLAMSGECFEANAQRKRALNEEMYEELLPQNYENSYLNPAYATERLKEYGQVLCAVYAEIRASLIYAYEQKLMQVVIRQELALELMAMFEMADVQKEDMPQVNEVKEVFRAFAFDYLGLMTEDSVCDSFLRTQSLSASIVMEADLSRTDYLYDYGEYISDTEIKMSTYLAGLPEDKIKSMADTYTQGYYKGFIATGKDITIKDKVEIRYFIGFERVVRAAVENFKAMGLESVIHHSSPSFMAGRGVIKRGIDFTNIGRQFDSDHEQDGEIYFDHAFMERKLEVYRDVLEGHKEALAGYGGPAVIECFGEESFTPAVCRERVRYTDGTKRLKTAYAARAGQILNRYVKGEERSFTIIAFPTPAIGKNFENIFDETVNINTLNYELYRDMQQVLIDTLDGAQFVRVKGMKGNRTDIKVNLTPLNDPESESKFENCVADVNIPVGEVFTSPKLEGTEGVLHVKEVFINGIRFVDLTIVFKDGIIDNISCGNYEDETLNRQLIDNYILFNHEFLPMGEFAIGTNTTAYRVTKKYDLGHVMPILIAEKTGPHFAVGDTCYSHEEEVETFNPDGKRLIAKENTYSLKRNTSFEEAYFNCHTDITIPYDELGDLSATAGNGKEISIIHNGRFVLEGLERLNGPLEEE